jgi:hypothetical protein
LVVVVVETMSIDQEFLAEVAVEECIVMPQLDHLELDTAVQAQQAKVILAATV